MAYSLLAIETSMEEKFSNRRILIVDDDKSILYTLKMRLEYLGYKVITATNALEGLFLAGSERPEVILLDIKMPGMNGIDVLESINILSPSTSVIIISAYEDEVVFRRSVLKDSCYYLKKPFSITALDEVITRAIETRSFEKL